MRLVSSRCGGEGGGRVGRFRSAVAPTAVRVCEQMEEVLRRLSEQEKALAFVGTTVVQTEQLLRDLEALDTQARVSRIRHEGAAENMADLRLLR